MGGFGSSAALRGIAWMLASGLLYTLSAGAIRYLARDIPVPELLFFRAVVALVSLTPFMLAQGMGVFKTNRLPMHASRAVFGFFGMLFSFYALSQMPIADVYALQFTLPLFTILLATILLKERTGWAHWGACLIGFIGTLIILRPGIATISPAAILALLSAMSFAGANISVRLLTRTDSATTITIYTNVILLPLALIPTVIMWVTPSWEQVPWIIFLAVTNTFGGFCIARAIGSAEARVVQPFDFLRLIHAAIIGWVLFAEFPDVWVWVGGAVIFTAAYSVLIRETRRAPK